MSSSPIIKAETMMRVCRSNSGYMPRSELEVEDNMATTTIIEPHISIGDENEDDFVPIEYSDKR